MVREERFQQILGILKKNGSIDYDSVAAILKVSDDTIRRDIDMMHQSGLLSKVRGGAIPLEKNPLSFRQRKNHHSKGKDIIAQKAQQFVQKGQTIFMDGGTTNYAIACHLPLNLPVRIITNNQALVPVLATHTNIEIVLLGGIYDRATETISGARACDEVRGYIADIYFMGVCAVDTTFGITAATNTDGEMKKAMVKSSHRLIVLSNKEKLDTTDHFKVCDLKQVDTLVTDLPGDHKKLNEYRGKAKII